MATWLKQSTAVTVRLGPFLDKTDGVTEETGAAPAVEVSKNHAAFGARSSATAIAHDSNGWFSVELNATDTGTVGPLIIKSDSAADWLPVWREFMVVPAAVYDSLVGGTDTLPADVTQWNGTNVATPDTAGYPKVTHKTGTGAGEQQIASGIVQANVKQISDDATAADNAESAFDGTGYNVGNSAIIAASVVGAVGSIATGGIVAGSFAANALAAAAIAADAVTKIQAGLSTLTTAQANAEADAALADAGVTTTRMAYLDAAISSRSTLGGTAQTGDAFARIGAAGAGLTALGDTRLAYLANLSGGAAALEATAQEIKAYVANISTTGAAINLPPSGFTLTTGTQSSGTYASTTVNDNTRHVITVVGTTIDCYYEFQLGADGVPVSVTVEGYLKEGAPAGGDTIALQAYNWVTVGWDTIDSAFWTGITTDTDSGKGATLFTSHVGSGTNNGLVRLRFYSTTLEAGTTLNTDSIYVSYAIVNRSVGYAMGAVWLDTSKSNTNTTAFVDGVADNPVSTLSAARTIATAVGLRRIHVSAGSSITLASDSSTLEFFGNDYAIALGGQIITGAHIEGAAVTGVGSGGAASFDRCSIGTATIPAGTELRECFLTSNSGGGITCGAAGDYFFVACASGIAGNNRPTITFAAGDCNVNLRNYSGGITLASMTTNCDVSVEGRGNVVIDASCTGGTVVIRGLFTLTNSGAGMTITDTARWAEDQSMASITALAASAIGDGVITDVVMNQMADHLIRRDLANTEVSAHGDVAQLLSIYGLVLSILNAFTSATTLTAKDPSGTTLGTAALTRDANSSPVVGVDG